MFLVYFLITQRTREETRSTFDETKIDMSAPCRRDVCDRMNFWKESAVVNEADLPWFELFALK
jgi:hypothetical protein